MDNTLILLSFAMVNHGSTFSHWLRDKLMKHYNLYHVNAVYLDSVVSRSGNTMHANTFGNAVPPPNVAFVSPDYRSHMRSPTGAIPIGARRTDWNELYTKAMSEAKAMIFVYTDEFAHSQWCMQEWSQFISESKRRPLQRPLKGIVLDLSGNSSLVLNGVPVQRVSAAKFQAKHDPLAWDKGDFIITESALQSLIDAIGNL
ncbi:toll/interleukin-1 receptor domain-containing protein [Microbulbifer thermotolerans]|uniref:hypothetical protein n=1 Tax=Microbulbifer thermotolerans TaxID=252514 RepID=UPI00224A8FC6|nr:hypothetical protein [Microbulbifer thermotolerans]MCX2841736.1 toll/interleukin-1 receptor domain-containing protein [Microbulbifer thermotolerans]